MDDNNTSDILTQLLANSGKQAESTNALLLRISNQMNKMSQAMLRMEADNLKSSSGSYIRDNTRVNPKIGKQFEKSDRSDHSKNPLIQMGKELKNSLGDFVDEFEYQLTDALVTSKIRDKFGKKLQGLADSLGVEVSELPQTFGKALANRAVNNIKNSKFGSKLVDNIDRTVNDMSKTATSRFFKGAHRYDVANGTNTVDVFRRNLQNSERSNVEGIRSQETASRIQESLESANSKLSGTASPDSSMIEHIDATVYGIYQILESLQADTKPDLEAIRASIDKTSTQVVESENIANAQPDLADLDKQSDQLYRALNSALTEADVKTAFNKFQDAVKDFNTNDILGSLQLIGRNSELQEGASEKLYTDISTLMNRSQNNLDPMLQGTGIDFGSVAGDIASKIGGDAIGSAADGVMNALSGLGGGILELTPHVLAAKAGMMLLKGATAIVTHYFNEAAAAVKEFVGVALKAADRDAASKSKAVEEANKRRAADIRTLIEEPFNILKDAAEKVEQAWQDALKSITLTQGYTKSDLQDLMSTFAQRIREGGLSDVVAGTDIINNLTKVLESGLSGVVAEEFAYQATLLNAAIPTQDFFSFASTYSSIAANAVKDGASQSEAIAKANRSLQDFADNLLYASRELSGGFSTGLTNASSLYEQAVKISQAARTGESNEIAGVLTAVAGIVGATAPDLANSITDAVYKAAVGGNDESTVALRSLAGVNASNTEFLQALATNPQVIFSALFSNLATIFNDSADAYMEKAEGYASLFGLSAEAFQRIDFEYLAQAIGAMNTDSSALDSNMKLLASGQATMTSEQLRIRQINEYMIDEGLSYVLDNEASRAIQQHMWDEQIALQLQEATYGVELVGSTNTMLTKIGNAVENIGNFIMHPIKFIASKVKNVSESFEQTESYENEIAEMLRLGNVGAQNQAELSKLVTYGQSFPIETLVSQMGGASAYMAGTNSTILNKVINALQNSSLSNGTSAENAVGHPASQYNWNIISKSDAAVIGQYLSSSTADYLESSQALSSHLSTATQSVQQGLANKVEQMLEDSYISQFTDARNPQTYEDWAASASKFGIADLSAALEEVGYTEEAIQNYFTQKEAEAGKAEEARLREIEENFYTAAINFYETWFPEEFKNILFDTHLTNIEEKLDTANGNLSVLIERDDTIIELIGTLDTDMISNISAAQVAITGVLNTIIGEDSKIGNLTEMSTQLTATITDLTELTSGVKSYLKSLVDYFVDRTFYNKIRGYSYDDIAAVQAKEKNGQGDAINALAEVLTQNSVDLRDPTMQTNALLAQILVVLNAMMQQNNDITNSPLSLKNTLSGLATTMYTT